MYFSPATLRPCHPALILVHSFCLCFKTPNLMRKDLLTYRVQGHIKSHTLESGSAVLPWSRTLTAFGRCSLQALTIHDWLIIYMLRSYFLLLENQRSLEKIEGLLGPLLPSSGVSSATALTGSQSASAWTLPMTGALSALQTTRFVVEPVYTGCSMHWSQLFLC